MPPFGTMPKADACRGQVARADGNGAKKQTCMMRPGLAAFAFLETKLRTSQLSLFDELTRRVLGHAGKAEADAEAENDATRPRHSTGDEHLVGISPSSRQPGGSPCARPPLETVPDNVESGEPESSEAVGAQDRSLDQGVATGGSPQTNDIPQTAARG